MIFFQRSAVALLLALSLSWPASAPAYAQQPSNSAEVKPNSESPGSGSGPSNPLTPGGAPRYSPRPRKGVEQGKMINLSLQDAITMMLEHNLDIQIEKDNIRDTEQSLKAARGVYDITTGAQFNYSLSNVPIKSALQSIAATLQTETYTYNSNVSRELPTGGLLRLDFNNEYLDLNSQFFSVNPSFTTDLILSLRQPLFRNLLTDRNRSLIRVIKKKIDMSDLALREKLVDLVARVQVAYYDLAYALRQEDILREGVDLAIEQLQKNQVEVEAGRVAPIEITSAEAEIERRKDLALSGMLNITEAENALKNLMIDDPASELWNYNIIPTEQIEFNIDTLNLQNAVDIAMQRRPELKQLDLQSEINKIELAYLKNQGKPQIDLLAKFSLQGLGGAPRPTSFFNPRPASAEVIGSYGTALENMFQFRSYQIGIVFSFPLRNSVAKANVSRALIATSQLEARKRKVVQSIIIDVRNAIEKIDIAAQRVEAARSAVVAADKQLQAEMARFEVGLSTNFFVLERQNNFSQARERELRAITDYIKARASLQKIIGNNLP